MTKSPFPTVRWGDQTVMFRPAPLPAEPAPWAVVVFARHQEGFVIAEIPERGWCTPSGRIEPDETPLQAAIRETREEIGAEICGLRYLGYYTLIGPEGSIRIAAAFAGRVETFGEIPAGSESLSARCFAREALTRIYWHWDALLERMFEYAESSGEDSPQRHEVTKNVDSLG